MQTFLMVSCGLLLGVFALFMATMLGSSMEEKKHSNSGIAAVTALVSFIASAALLIFARG